MGNSQSNPHEYTPEQYKQYLEYQEQQKHVTQFTPNPLPANIQKTTQPLTHDQNTIHVINNNTALQSSQTFLKQNVERPQTYNNPNQAKYTVNSNNNVNIEYNNQQKTRSHIKAEINLDNKIIPDLQQKKYMPSVENHFQDAYQQRMIDNLSIGSKNMVSGATYTGKPDLYNVRNTTHYNNMDQFTENNNSINTYQSNHMGSKGYNVSNVSNVNYDREAQFIKNEKARELEFIRMQEKRIEEEQCRFKEEQHRRRAQFSEELSEVENLKYDPSQILGLDKNVKHDINDIKKAYRNLALKYHPDKGGSEEIFKILTKAYIALTKKNEKDNYN